MTRCDARPSRVDTWWKMIHGGILASAEAPSFLFQVETDTGSRTVGTRCTTCIKVQWTASVTSSHRATTLL